jgi:hypothetical protein
MTSIGCYLLKSDCNEALLSLKFQCALAFARNQAMSDESLGNTHVDCTPVEFSASVDPAGSGSSGTTAGEHSTQEITKLKAECERLSVLLREVEKERDAYQNSLTHYLAQQITREDVELAATMEVGVTFDVILQDLERIDRVYNSADKP